MAARLLIYIVAGEASGDSLGAHLMESLRNLAPQVEFAGIGGPLMQRQGLVSLFPYHDLSLLGFSEIVPHIPRILKRLKQTATDIKEKQPSAVITIDCPGFNFRLAERLMKNPATASVPRIQYVAPTVWAYKPWRAAQAAKLFHHMLLLLPFEPPYFEKEGLSCTHVGHPILWEKYPRDGQAFRERHAIPAQAPVICLLPGSRRREILRLMPIYEQTLALLKFRYPALQAVVVAGRQVTDLVVARAQRATVPMLVVGEEEKKEAFAASNVALSKSGTVTLELARAGVPMVVTYKVSSYSAWSIRRLIKVPYYSLINIIENEEVIPEMMQEECRPDLLAGRLIDLLEDGEIHRTQIARVDGALRKLGGDLTQSPSDHAAQKVLEIIRP